MKVYLLFLFGVSGWVPPQPPPPVIASIQKWDMTTLLRQARLGRVRRAAFRDDRRVVAILDSNGLMRNVDLFPPAVPMLVHELHDANVNVEIAPPPRRAPAPLITLVRQGFLIAIFAWILEMMGMLWVVLAGLMMWTSAIQRGVVKVWNERRGRNEDENDGPRN